MKATRYYSWGIGNQERSHFRLVPRTHSKSSAPASSSWGRLQALTRPAGMTMLLYRKSARILVAYRLGRCLGLARKSRSSELIAISEVLMTYQAGMLRGSMQGRY